MKKIEKIKDFIQSFFYYPKMRKYFRNKKMEQYDIWKSAVRYAWWHCQDGKLKPDDKVSDYSDDWHKNEKWKPIYKHNPLEKM